MKRINVCLVAIMLACGLAYGESAIFGWKAETGPVLGVGVVECVTLDGPSMRNKLPDKHGVFDGEFVFAPAWDTQLTAIHVANARQDGTLTTRQVKFEVAATETDRDPAYQKTRFKTESLDFDEGDMFVFVFKTSKGTEMVSARISKKFVPM